MDDNGAITLSFYGVDGLHGTTMGHRWDQIA